jgi:hypothetical protein
MEKWKFFTLSGFELTLPLVVQPVASRYPGSRQYNMVMSPAGLGLKNDWAGEGQQQLQTTPNLSSVRMLHKDYERISSVGKNAGRDPKGPLRQDELIGGKPPVVK